VNDCLTFSTASVYEADRILDDWMDPGTGCPRSVGAASAVDARRREVVWGEHARAAHTSGR